MDVRVLQVDDLDDAVDAARMQGKALVGSLLAAGDEPGRSGGSVQQAGDRRGTVVFLKGRLDATTVGDVRARLHELVHDGVGDFVVDVSGTEVGDATGLGMLVGLHRGAERCERHLVLQGVPPRLMRMLRATKLHRILRVASATLVAPVLDDPTVDVVVSAAC